MNCAQHTDTAAVAYCRSCGKALCEACKRDVQGTIYCEPCLAARIHPGAGGNFRRRSQRGLWPPRAPEDASPGLALFLGFIPGVGAFYNGQFLKGFVHVDRVEHADLAVRSRDGSFGGIADRGVVLLHGV